MSRNFTEACRCFIVYETKEKKFDAFLRILGKFVSLDFTCFSLIVFIMVIIFLFHLIVDKTHYLLDI